MSDELETGALASAGGLSSPEGEYENAGTACRNCGTIVNRRYCGHCGQLAQSFHRPVWHLFSEMVGDFFALDGRAMRTLPALIFRPGRVTRTYLDGKRQRFVPPFRLFLLTSFLYFLGLFAFGDSQGWFHWYANPAVDGITLDNTTAEGAGNGVPLVIQDLNRSDDEPLDPEAEALLKQSQENVKRFFLEDGRINRAAIDESACDEPEEQESGSCEFMRMVGHRLADAYENQGMLFASIQSWAPRLALICLPVLVFLLTLSYPFSKRAYVYDHIITAMHFQSWLYILLGVGLVFLWLGQVWFVIVLMLAPPVYLYRMLRVVYDSGRFLSVFRTFMIMSSLNVVLLLLVIATLVLGVADTSPILGGASQN